MSKIEDGGPAFPVPLNQNEPWSSMGPCDGMTLRQYAAIKLRAPNSGTDWLDELIRTSLRDEFAAKAMLSLPASKAYVMADAMLAARGEKK